MLGLPSILSSDHSPIIRRELVRGSRLIGCTRAGYHNGKKSLAGLRKDTQPYTGLEDSDGD